MGARRVAREFLESRDRELEHWLRLVATNAVSVTAVSQAIWTPAAHASTHSTAGGDWVSPGSIGAPTTAEMTAADADVAATAAAATLAVEGLGWTVGGKVDWEARKAAAAALAAAGTGTGMDEGAAWMQGPQTGNEERRARAAADDADALRWAIVSP